MFRRGCRDRYSFWNLIVDVATGCADAEGPDSDCGGLASLTVVHLFFVRLPRKSSGKREGPCVDCPWRAVDRHSRCAECSSIGHVPGLSLNVQLGKRSSVLEDRLRLALSVGASESSMTGLVNMALPKGLVMATVAGLAEVYWYW